MPVIELQMPGWWRYLWALVAALALAFAGYLFGANTSAPKPENTAPVAAQSQPDGSLILERKPEARPTPAPHKIPKGAIEERRVGIKLKPPAFESAAGCKCDPKPLDVSLSLVREGDGRRVIASSPQGQILAGLDMPIEPVLMPPEPHPWAAGLSMDQGKRPGVWIERDFGRVRLGADAYRAEAGGLGGRLRVGWVW